MKHTLKILIGLALAVIGSQAQAVPIDITVTGSLTTTIDGVLCSTVTNPACWEGSSPTNPKAGDISSLVGVADLVSLYKADVGVPVVEEGPFTSSYKTTFSNTSTDPEDALIEYISGDSISCPECFLLVKDGAAHTPIWYVFDIGSWDGLGDIIITDFWPTLPDGTSGGAISHVEIFGNSSNVPEPGMIGLLAIGLIGVVVARRRMKV